VNDPVKLGNIYGTWTALLHKWVAERGYHLDCEYFPDEYSFKLYSGHAREGVIQEYHTVPRVGRPVGERVATIRLARPEEDPSKEDLDQKFRELCLAAARILQLNLGKKTLYGPIETTNQETGEKIIVPHRGPIAVRSRRGRPPKKQPPPLPPHER
jgi:hypothetical protein